MFRFSRRFWLISLAISLSYLIFEGLVQNKILTRDGFESVQIFESKVKQDTSQNERVNNRSDSSASKNVFEKGSAASESTAINKHIAKDFESDVTKNLMEKGFSAGEAETVIAELLKNLAITENGPDRLALGIKAASSALNLSLEREQALRESITNTLSEMGGNFRFSDWESCVQKRLERLGEDACIQGLVNRFLIEVKDKLPGEEMTEGSVKSLGPLEKQYSKDAIKECGLEFGSAFRLFALRIQDCN